MHDNSYLGKRVLLIKIDVSATGLGAIFSRARPDIFPGE
jgi:hypothetical protein